MEISAKAVMDLRKKTGVSMMACKKALTEAGGDEDKAVEILRKSGEAKAMKKADRETTEGVVVAKISDDNKKAVIVKIGCETDFVARNDAFIEMADKIADIAMNEGVDAANAQGEEMVKEGVVTLGENMKLAGVDEVSADFVISYIHSNNKVGSIVGFTGAPSEETAKDVAMHVVASAPNVVNPEDTDMEAMEKEKDLYREQLIQEGKPENMLDQILEGKMKKFKEENALLTQAFVKDPSQKVADILGDGVAIVEFKRLAI